MKKIKISLLAISLAATYSCVSDDGAVDVTPVDTVDYSYDSGLFITNEGPFGGASGSLSYLDNNGDLTNGLYASINTGLELGNVVQSGAVYSDSLYIVVNNAHRLVVSDLDLNHVGAIEKADGLNNPRYIAHTGNEAYVTNWGEGSDPLDDFVSIIDTKSLTISKSISVSEGPERIVESNGNLYVLHKGAWGSNNKISVISAGSQSVSSEIEVGYLPQSFYILNNKLVVLSSGKSAWTGSETLASVATINLTDNMVESTFEFPETEHPKDLATNGFSNFYLKLGAVYRSDLDFSNEEEFIAGNFNSLSLRDGKLYLTDAKDYVSAGEFSIYESINSNQAVLLSKNSVGLIPSSVIFNK